jgi:hypothetical protein
MDMQCSQNSKYASRTKSENVVVPEEGFSSIQKLIKVN